MLYREKMFMVVWGFASRSSASFRKCPVASDSCVGVGNTPTPSATFRNGLSVPEWSRAISRTGPNAFIGGLDHMNII